MANRGSDEALSEIVNQKLDDIAKLQEVDMVSYPVDDEKYQKLLMGRFSEGPYPKLSKLKFATLGPEMMPILEAINGSSSANHKIVVEFQDFEKSEEVKAQFPNLVLSKAPVIEDEKVDGRARADWEMTADLVKIQLDKRLDCREVNLHGYPFEDKDCQQHLLDFVQEKETPTSWLQLPSQILSKGKLAGMVLSAVSETMAGLGRRSVGVQFIGPKLNNEQNRRFNAINVQYGNIALMKPNIDLEAENLQPDVKRFNKAVRKDRPMYNQVLRREFERKRYSPPPQYAAGSGVKEEEKDSQKDARQQPRVKEYAGDGKGFKSELGKIFGINIPKEGKFTADLSGLLGKGNNYKSLARNLMKFRRAVQEGRQKLPYRLEKIDLSQNALSAKHLNAVLRMLNDCVGDRENLVVLVAPLLLQTKKREIDIHDKVFVQAKAIEKEPGQSPEVGARKREEEKPLGAGKKPGGRG